MGNPILFLKAPISTTKYYTCEQCAKSRLYRLGEKDLCQKRDIYKQYENKCKNFKHIDDV